MQNAKWYKARGRCLKEEYDLVSYELFEAGVSALEELESESPLHTEFCFYTGDKAEREKIVEAFSGYFFEVSEEDARDWDKWWRDRAEPVSVSQRLWVRPPWVEFSPKNLDEVVLELEAKTAFGTGEHETTSSAAELLENCSLFGKKVLDIGMGTGILTMFARRLGAECAFGTEIDPLALPCIAENFTRNGFLDSGAVLGFLDVFADDVKFDVIVCNMIRLELWPLRKDIENLLAEGGRLIISGQLEAEKNYVLDWFREASLSVEKEIVRGEWWSVCAELKTHKNNGKGF